MNSKSRAAWPWEKAEDQAGPNTLRCDGCSLCLFLQPEGGHSHAAPREDPAVTRIQKLPLGRVLVCSLVLPARTAMFCQLPGWQLSSSCSRRPKQAARRRPLKSLSGLAALSSGLPPRNPTASDGQAPPELRKEGPSFQKTCSQAQPCWKPLRTVLGGWDHGFLQTHMGFGVQKGSPKISGCQAQP